MHTWLWRNHLFETVDVCVSSVLCFPPRLNSCLRLWTDCFHGLPLFATAFAAGFGDPHRQGAWIVQGFVNIEYHPNPSTRTPVRPPGGAVQAIVAIPRSLIAGPANDGRIHENSTQIVRVRNIVNTIWFYLKQTCPWKKDSIYYIHQVRQDCVGFSIRDVSRFILFLRFLLIFPFSQYLFFF